MLHKFLKWFSIFVLFLAQCIVFVVCKFIPYPRVWFKRKRYNINLQFFSIRINNILSKRFTTKYLHYCITQLSEVSPFDEFWDQHHLCSFGFRSGSKNMEVIRWIVHVSSVIRGLENNMRLFCGFYRTETRAVP